MRNTVKILLKLRIGLFVFFSMLVISCESPKHNHEQTGSKDSVSIVVSDSSTQPDVSDENSDDEVSGVEEDMALTFIVSVAEGYNYDSLHRIALQASEVLGYPMDSSSAYYNQKKKRIVLADNDEDDIWAGEYRFRRFSDERVSLEMRYAYIDTIIANNDLLREKLQNDSTRMFVCANLTDEATALKLRETLLPKFPQTKIIAAKVYVGCMH